MEGAIMMRNQNSWNEIVLVTKYFISIFINHVNSRCNEKCYSLLSHCIVHNTKTRAEHCIHFI